MWSLVFLQPHLLFSVFIFKLFFWRPSCSDVLSFIKMFVGRLLFTRAGGSIPGLPVFIVWSSSFAAAVGPPGRDRHGSAGRKYKPISFRCLAGESCGGAAALRSRHVPSPPEWGVSDCSLSRAAVCWLNAPTGRLCMGRRTRWWSRASHEVVLSFCWHGGPPRKKKSLGFCSSFVKRGFGKEKPASHKPDSRWSICWRHWGSLMTLTFSGSIFLLSQAWSPTFLFCRAEK